MYKYLFFILGCLLFTGCSSGIKPLKFRNGQALPSYSGRVHNPIIYTNSVQLVRPTGTNKVLVEIPVTITKSNRPNNTNEISVTIPKKMEIIIITPEQTNNVVLSGIVEKTRQGLSSGAIFLYYFIIGICILIGFYLWGQNKTKKPKENKIKISSPSPTIEK